MFSSLKSAIHTWQNETSFFFVIDQMLSNVNWKYK